MRGITGGARRAAGLLEHNRPPTPRPVLARAAVRRTLGADFGALWFGQTLSLFGSAVTFLALPTVAILTLHATPSQVGLLGALEFAAFPILGLAVGVWADRFRRRRIMIAADALRAVVLATIFGAALAARLTFAHLAIAAALLGIGSVFFEICYQAYLPTIVRRDDLPAANARLEFTRSLAQIGGNGLAGPLIAAIGAPLALGVDALSFVVSILSLALVRKPEFAPPARPRHARSFVVDLREGLDVVLRSPALRAIAGCTATSNFGGAIIGAVLLVFAYREVHLTPTTMGVVFAASNLGFAGAALATWCVRRLGLGVTLAVTMFAYGAAGLCLPLAASFAPAAVIFAVELTCAFVTPIYNINQVSFRQSIVPPALQGRMNATMRTIVWGTLPLGSLVGGVLGSTIGIVPTIRVGGAVEALACVWILTGSVVRIRAIPATSNVSAGPS